jgi:RNA-dependent RNA polymerase
MHVDTDVMNMEQDKLLDFLLQCFVLCGRIFRPFASNDCSLYLMETNLDFEQIANKDFSDQHRISFTQFVNSHNPLHLNSKQVFYSLVHVSDLCH